jgi:DNA-binding MarR family transcriptional regulator
MLTETEWRLLDAAVDEPTMGELADRLSKSPGRISQVVADLGARELVAVERDGRAKRVFPAATSVFEQYQALAGTHSHIDFAELLSPTVLRVCWFLATPTPVADIAPYLTVSRERVYQVLQTLQQRGIIRKDDQQYALVEDLLGVHDLAVAAVRHEHRVRLQAVTPYGRLRWAAPHEALAAASDVPASDGGRERSERDGLAEDPAWTLTGLPRFGDYGLDFIQGQPPTYYWSELAEPSGATTPATETGGDADTDAGSEEEATLLAPEALICHTLLLDAGPRRAGYAALLAAATDIDTDRLRRLGRYYGVADLIDGLCRFRSLPPAERTREAVAPFPDQDRFADLAAQYGVGP